MASAHNRTRRQRKRNSSRRILLGEVQKQIEMLGQADQLVFTRLIEENVVEQLFEELAGQARHRIYTPHVTLAAFLGQAISDDGSCQQAVHRVNKHRCSQGLPPASVDTNSYCEARHRLPEELLLKLLKRSAEMVQWHEPEAWLWKERRVVLVDGCTVRAADTLANQATFPQPSSQEPGLGFPQVRQLVAISLSSAVVLDVQIGPVEGKHTGELSLFRRMTRVFRRGDVVVADANFDSYVDIATLKQQRVDFVGAIAGSRTSPFTGKCRCIEDIRVRLERPKFDKNRFTREQWEALPQSLNVRIIRYQTDGRNEEITIITTLLDQERYPARSIAELYGYRWNCELDLRSIKTVLGMEELRCKNPEMLRREIYIYFLAYNLVRAAICDAARLTGQEPRKLSFKNAVQAIVEYASLVSQDEHAIATMLWSIACNNVGNRPGRKEPRKIKHRRNKYSYMTKPRAEEREALNA
jgi:hypothetical protein